MYKCIVLRRSPVICEINVVKFDVNRFAPG